MLYTSAQANKLLKKLTEQRNSILYKENTSKVFIAATTENLEDARPAYDYAETQRQLAAVEADIQTVKHCINVFNTTHVVEGFDRTVDQMLVYIPQLTERKDRLWRMAAQLPKQRMTNNNRSNLIEYQYANYDPEEAMRDFQAASDELARAQLALDHLNNTDTMEIPIE